MPWEKQFDVDAALERAMEAFWSKGYEATSTQDLLHRMGINRGSLYDTFGNKRDLFLESLKCYLAQYQSRKLAAATRGRAPQETIRILFESLVSDATNDSEHCGCFLVNTALDMAPHDKEIGRVVAKGFRQIETFFRTTIENGQESGSISSEIDAIEVSRALLGLMIGVRVLARSLPNKSLLESISSKAVKMLE